MGNVFRQRCESALTHPVTVAALAVLLLNDLVLKTLWSHPWTTGKLSDLAWMVFAPPLLAFLLSLTTRRNRAAERAAFIASYVGLPLLYAAFNTVAPVHDTIVQGLLLLSGAPVGSPLDVADSLVIPPAMAIAWWVWGRPAPGLSSIRARLGLLAAAAMAVASVASQPTPSALGVTSVWTEPDDTVMAAATYDYEWPDYFTSKDGGLTWAGVEPTGAEPQDEDLPRQQRVETPRGAYAIEGAAIVLTRPDGSRREVFSAQYLRNDSNRWVQYESTESVEEETWAIRVISRGPSSITYDRTTGNVIAAMGLQGVVVGSPDGRWTSIRMDIYGPTDFSSEAKLRLISTDTHAWLIVIATTLTFATAGLIASFTFTRYNTDTLLLGIGSGVLVAIPLILTARSDEWTILTLPLLVVLFIPLPVAVVDSSLGRGLRVYLATCSFFLLAAVWYTYFLITHIGDPVGTTGAPLDLAYIVLLVAAATMVVPYVKNIRQLRALAPVLLGAAGVFVSSAAAVLSWLLVGTSVVFLVVGVFLVSGLITAAVVRHQRMTAAAETLAAVQREPTQVRTTDIVAAVASAFFLTPVFGAVLQFPFLLFLYGAAHTVFSAITALVAAIGVAWAIERIMALDRNDAGLGPAQRRRWRAAVRIALVSVGLVSTLCVFAVLSSDLGYYVPFIRISAWTDLIPVLVLPVVVAYALVLYLSRLRKDAAKASQHRPPGH